MDDLSLLTALAGGTTEPTPPDNAPASKRVRREDDRGKLANLDIEPFSGIRMKLSERRLSRSDMSSLASSFDVRRLEEVPRMMRGGGQLPAAWLTIGVLVDKGPAKTTQRGDSFCNACW